MELNVNFEEIPDKVPVLEPGQYTFDVVSLDHREAQGKAGENYRASLRVNDGPAGGKRFDDTFWIEDLGNPTSFTAVRMKHLLLSLGMDPKVKHQTEDFVGKSGTAIVTNRTYQDKEGSTQQAAQVKDYIYKK